MCFVTRSCKKTTTKNLVKKSIKKYRNSKYLLLDKTSGVIIRILYSKTNSN